MRPALACCNLSCSRANWREERPSRFGAISAEFPPGELCGITGPDGCGKGLLLNVLGLIEPPDTGSVVADGRSALDLDPVERGRLRDSVFGFLFSQPALLPSFSVAENVAMPLFRICNEDPETARDRTLDMLAFCGISGSGNTAATDLAPGTQARAALARALVHRPRVLIALSPLDETGLLPIARNAAERFGLCIVWAGTPRPLARFAHRILQIEDGQITGDFAP